LWAFLPWSILMYYAIIKSIRNSILKMNWSKEFYTLSGSLLALLVFSFSGFQLPHYTNIIFPLLAILTANFIWRAVSGTEMRLFAITQYGVILLIFACLFFLQILFRPESNLILAIPAFVITGGVIVFFVRSRMNEKTRVIFYSCLASILLNFYLNLVFYPQLLFYQSGSRVAEYVNTHYPGQALRTLGVLPFTVHFHADGEVRIRTLDELGKELEKTEMLVFTSTVYLDSLDMINVDYQILEEFDHYHTTKVTGTFLNHKTREEALRKQFLLSAIKRAVRDQ
ncbi:MAG: hypothetical protein KAT15_31740, partial [Bacteroidales bacterium]|nr:hypothetical protein [Bacteroidales bacterium]